MIPTILAKRKALGYPVFTKDLSLNITFERRLPDTPNKFDDLCHLHWMRDGKWESETLPATTDPGEPWLSNPMNPKGCAVLLPNVWRFIVGKHRGLWGMQQAERVTVWRDRNRDQTVDRSGPVDTGFFGINIHYMGRAAGAKIGKYSAGCMGIPGQTNWATYQRWVKASAAIYGPTFTVALIETNKDETR